MKIQHLKRNHEADGAIVGMRWDGTPAGVTAISEWLNDIMCVGDEVAIGLVTLSNSERVGVFKKRYSISELRTGDYVIVEKTGDGTPYVARIDAFAMPTMYKTIDGLEVE